MKTLGMIGGSSWVSTVDYYTYINKMVNDKLGGIASAKILMYSMNMEDLFRFASVKNWDGLAYFLSEIAKKLEGQGAEALVICANTPHIVADAIQKNIGIPLINIAEETAKEIARQKISKAILLGTMITMEQDFFKQRLLKYGIQTVIPEQEDREFIHGSIFSELGKWIILPATKKRYQEIIEGLTTTGKEGVILGCTELPMLIKQEDCPIATFDTTLIHAKAAVEFMMSE